MHLGRGNDHAIAGILVDGGHKLDHFIRDTLGEHVDFVPVCPEVECGLGVPREAMRLEGDVESPRLVTIRTKVDLTERMLKWAGQRVRELEKEDLCGFIFKSKSPSSGMERVKVYNENGMPVMRGVGLFALKPLMKIVIARAQRKYGWRGRFEKEMAGRKAGNRFRDLDAFA